MKKKISALLVAVLLVSTAGCSSFDGSLSETHKSYTDDFGRSCTASKWGETGGLDCDWPQK